jgi:hypothetical protein
MRTTKESVIDSSGADIFLFAIVFRADSGLTQPFIKCEPGIFLRVGEVVGA